MKRNICIIICLLLLLITTVVGILPEFAFATTLQGAFSDEEKVYCFATIEDEFAEDSVIVVLDKNIK